ncbi:MAG TPA: response regulator [bacterium]|nr:response regulator [bacterium]
MDTSSRVRVLLVDDEALIRMGLRVMLRELGYEVAGEAADGHQAVAKVTELAPDVVIMDIKMPGMDGLEATRRIMATHPVPIIVLSAYNQQGLVAEAADAGVLAYLMKPVREAELQPAIEVARARFAELAWLRRRPPGAGEADAPRVAEATRRLAERYRLSADDAAARLRRLAKASGRTITEVADAIVALDEP